MDSTIHLAFRYTERDYVRAARANAASRARLWLDIQALLVSAFVGFYFLHSTPSYWYGVGMLGLSALLVLMFVAAFVVIPRMVFRSDPKFQDEYSLDFSPEGIHFRTDHIDSQLQWSLYSKALIDVYSFVLYYGTRSFTVIPKRVFESAEQEAAFEKLLMQNVSQIVRR